MTTGAGISIIANLMAAATITAVMVGAVHHVAHRWDDRREQQA